MEKVQTEKNEMLCREKAALRGRILKERNALLAGQRKIWDEQIFGQLVQMDKAFPCPVYLCYVSYKSEVSTKEFILWCLEKEKIVFVPKVSEKKVPEQRNTGTENSRARDHQRAEDAGTEDAQFHADKNLKINDMEFYQITAWEELQAGYQGILEPEALPEKSFTEWIVRSDILGQFAGTRRSVTTDHEETAEKKTAGKIRMLMPGAVFDRRGNRIGYGGGFYDRWLTRWNHTAQGKQGVLEKIGLAYHIQMTNCIPAEAFDQKADRVITDQGHQLTISNS